MSRTYKSLCQKISDDRKITFSSQDDEYFIVKNYEGESIGTIAFSSVKDFNDFVDNLVKLRSLVNTKQTVDKVLENA